MARHTVDERVQDRHGTVGDTSVGVDLLQDWKTCQKTRSKIATGFSEMGKQTLVDVRRVSLLARLGALLLVTRGGSLLAGILLLRGLGGSSGSLGGGLLVGSFGRHG